MNVIWASSKSNNVFEAVAAVEHALGEAEQTLATTPTEELFMGDTYLAENVGTMRARWEINPWATAPAGPGIAGRIFAVGQRAVRKLTWWYLKPQTDQVSHFNAAVVRATDALLARVLRLAQRLHELESTHSEPRLRSFEEQLRVAREEHNRLLQRVAQLEAELATLQGRGNGVKE
ncbi:MAG: hypothetical protein HXY37_08165 [Chloroflexi bacterium]|nr:hypothetical protein [Chloroflexota bacterium]